MKWSIYENGWEIAVVESEERAKELLEEFERESPDTMFYIVKKPSYNNDTRNQKREENYQG